MGATIIARIGQQERIQLQELADRNDRTLSREVRRAIRWYLAISRSGEAALNHLR
jgi:predicted transcriptional regulator